MDTLGPNIGPLDGASFNDIVDNGSGMNPMVFSIENRTCDIGSYVGADDNILFFITLGISVGIAFLYCFLQKRKHPVNDCNVPSIVVPVNLVQSTPERWVYVLMFGSLSGVLLLSIVTNGFAVANSGNESIAGAPLSTVFVMLAVSVVYYPAFASIRAPIPILGYIIGFFFTILLFIESFYRLGVTLNGCVQDTDLNTATVWVFVAALTPVSISHLVVIGWFLYKIPAEIYRLAKSDKPFKQAVYELAEDQRNSKRVKWLLSKWPLDPGDKENEDIQEFSEEIAKVIQSEFKRKLAVWKVKVAKYILFKYDPLIYFPLRFLGAIVVMVYIIYILTLSLCTISLINILPIARDIEDAEDEIEDVAEFLVEHDFNYFNLSRVILIAYGIVRDSTTAATVIIPLGPLFSFVVCIVLLIHMIRSVHNHLRKISKGNYDFLPSTLASPAYRLVHSMQFMGFQIGYFTWAWILLTLFVWLCGVAGLIFHFLLQFFLNTVVRVIIAIGSPLVYSLGIYYGTLIFSKIAFVGDTNNKHVVINNLRLFHLVSYLLIFQNAVVGITSAFIRILYSLMFGLLLLFRLDRVVLMKGFEKYDKGHKSYIAFLYLEHTLNNAVLTCFVELLLVGHRQRKAVEERNRRKTEPLALAVMEDWMGKTEIDSYPRVSQRALNRWCVAYTLVHNPGLVKHTAKNLLLKKKDRKKKNWANFLGEQSISTAPTPVQQELEGGVDREVTPVLPDTPLGNTSTFQLPGNGQGAGEEVMELLEVGRGEREEEGGEPDSGSDLADGELDGELEDRTEDDNNVRTTIS